VRRRNRLRTVGLGGGGLPIMGGIRVCWIGLEKGARWGGEEIEERGGAGWGGLTTERTVFL
jgi:hypothetical protein